MLTGLSLPRRYGSAVREYQIWCEDKDQRPEAEASWPKGKVWEQAPLSVLRRGRRLRSRRETKFFILTCAMTQRPFRCADDLSELKRDMLERGDDVEYFHACNDRKFIRAEVFEHIRLYEQFFAVYYAAVEKSVGDPEFSTPGDIYCNLFDTLFKSINRDFELDSASKIIAVTDKLPSDIKKKEYTQRLKAVLKRHAPGRFTIAHHRSMSSYNLQIADYYCWAIQRSREQGDNGHVLSLKAIRSGLEFWAPMKKQEPPGD
ncbi:MAG: DUF3800 domain-containing protein [Slackia sp.]